MPDTPSKSARKRAQEPLKILTERLLALSDPQLGELELPERLRTAVIAARTMRARGALRRQRQLITKHLRTLDTEPLETALRRLTAHERRVKSLFRDAEYWRDQLAEHGEAALTAFAERTQTEPAALRPLVAELGRSVDRARTRRLKRQLFRAVHELLQAEMHGGSSKL